MPEIFVNRPFILRGDAGRPRHFRPSTMRFRVSDTEAKDPILQDCCIVIPDPEKEPEPKKKGTRRGSTND